MKLLIKSNEIFKKIEWNFRWTEMKLPIKSNETLNQIK